VRQLATNCGFARLHTCIHLDDYVLTLGHTFSSLINSVVCFPRKVLIHVRYQFPRFFEGSRERICLSFRFMYTSQIKVFIWYTQKNFATKTFVITQEQEQIDIVRICRAAAGYLCWQGKGHLDKSRETLPLFLIFVVSSSQDGAE
jgi:hypothetical protein